MGCESRFCYGPPLAGCERPEAVVDCEAALAVLHSYFKAAQEEFGKFERDRLGGKRSARVILECAPWDELPEDWGVRNYAATSEDGRTILVAPELVELPPDSVAAIMAHEFGHALDYLYPGRLLVARGELLSFEDARGGDEQGDQARLARMLQWKRIHEDRDAVENTADQIASAVLGREIRYAGPCLLQTFARAAARPKGLR